MAASSLPTIMAAVETRLKTISGLRTSPLKTDAVSVPMAVVVAPDIASYRETFGRGKMQLALTVELYVSGANIRVGQQQLAAYMDRIGASSIYLAIEGDRTLGGTVDDCIVEGAVNHGLDQTTGLNYFVAKFTLRLIAAGS